MKKSFALIGVVLLALVAGMLAQNADAWRGTYETVTMTSTDVTSTVTEIDGSELGRAECIVTNPNTSFDIYLGAGSNTYSARYYVTIPAGKTVRIPGHNLGGTYAINNTYYAYVSPTPLTISVGFISFKPANPDPTR
jgi:hypothetical protein